MRSSAVFSTALLTMLLLALNGCVVDVEEALGEFDPAYFSREEPLESTTSLKAEVNLGLGNLKVADSDEEMLFELDIEYNGNSDKPEVDFSREGNSARLRVDLEGKKGSGWWGDDNRIDLLISPGAGLDARLITGVGENIVDLSELRVETLEIVNGVGSTEIYKDKPNEVECSSVEVTNGIGHLEMTGLGNYAFEDFSFHGGIGESTLDFSGEWKSVGDIQIKVGLGSLKVILPEELGVRIRSSKSFLSNIEMPDFDQIGNEYLSRNIEDAEKEISINLNTGIGEVRFIRE